MAANNEPRIIGYDPNTGAPIYSSPSNNSRKIIKSVLIGGIVLVVGIVGWIIYDTFFNMEKVDLFAYDEGITVSGYSGTGILEYHIEDYMGDYIGDPMYRNEFYNSVTYTPDKTDGLSNGDKVTITASYDKKLAKKAKIKVRSDKKEYEVSGLGERFAADGSDIPQDEFAAMKSFMNDYMARSLNDGYGNAKSEGLAALFYVSPKTSDYDDSFDDQLIGIYKVTYVDDWDGSTDVSYVRLTMSPIRKGPDYKSKIDQMERDGELYMSEGYSTDTLAEQVNDIKTEHNRDTVTELKKD